MSLPVRAAPSTIGKPASDLVSKVVAQSATYLMIRTMHAPPMPYLQGPYLLFHPAL